MIAAGRRSNTSRTAGSMLASDRLSSVPNVSTRIDTGWATPMAYATWTSQRLAAPAATTCLATQRAA